MTFNDLMQQALLIFNAKLRKENTAKRVGGLFRDILNYFKELIDTKASKEELANATDKFKGYHPSLAELQAAYPQAQNLKDFFAWVGAAYPGTVWKVNADKGAWTDTGKVPPQPQVDLANYIKKGNITENITKDKDTIPSNFAVNILKSKLYDGTGIVLCQPSTVIRDYVIEADGSLYKPNNSIKYATSGLLSTVEGDVINFSGLTSTVRYFDKNKNLILELTNTPIEYITPANAVYLATNDSSNSAMFCTITKGISSDNKGDIPALYEIIKANETKIETKTGKNTIKNISQDANNYAFPTRSLARNSISSELRANGQIITYKLVSGEWVREQFIGTVGSGTQSGIIFSPSMVLRKYTTEADGTLKAQTDVKYGTTGHVPVVVGATIKVTGKTVNSIRLFDNSKKQVTELTNSNEFVVPSNVTTIALNDNVNSATFCTVETTDTGGNWLDPDAWIDLQGKADELLEASGFKTKVDIDDFTDAKDIDRINNAIEFVNLSGGGVVEINRDVLIDSSIIIRSNVYLLFSKTIKVADKTFDTIIRNSGIVVNTAKPNDVCLELNENRNIKILGVGSKARIEGCDIPYKGTNPKTGIEEDFVGDFFGWRTISILFANVKDYEIGNFYITKTKCWSISQEWGCENGHIHDINLYTTAKNGDGVNCRNGCKNILIENITGTTLDDSVACSALDASFMTPASGYVWSMQAGGFAWKSGDDAGIFDITIKNVSTISDHNIVRLLATTAKVQRIGISGISNNTGHKGGQVILISTGYGTGYVKGNIGDVYINNSTSVTSARTIYCTAAIIKGWFNKIKGSVYVVGSSDNVKVTNNS